LDILRYQVQRQVGPVADEQWSLATTMIAISDDDGATDLGDAIGQQDGTRRLQRLDPFSDTVPANDGYWGTHDHQSTALNAIRQAELQGTEHRSQIQALIENWRPRPIAAS